MEKVEAVRLALAELGDAPVEQLAAFVHARYGVKVDPKVVPFIKAMLRDKEMLVAFRQEVRQGTVADCFKYRNKVGLDVAIDALRDCWRSKKATMDELWVAARVCRMANVMRPYLESLP